MRLHSARRKWLRLPPRRGSNRLLRCHRRLGVRPDLHRRAFLTSRVRNAGHRGGSRLPTCGRCPRHACSRPKPILDRDVRQLCQRGVPLPRCSQTRSPTCQESRTTQRRRSVGALRRSPDRRRIGFWLQRQSRARRGWDRRTQLRHGRQRRTRLLGLARELGAGTNCHDSGTDVSCVGASWARTVRAHARSNGRYRQSKLPAVLNQQLETFPVTVRQPICLTLNQRVRGSSPWRRTTTHEGPSPRDRWGALSDTGFGERTPLGCTILNQWRRPGMAADR